MVPTMGPGKSRGRPQINNPAVSLYLKHPIRDLSLVASDTAGGDEDILIERVQVMLLVKARFLYWITLLTDVGFGTVI